MSVALLGRKLGMTRMFTEDGENIPITVIQAGPCTITQMKNAEDDGYAAIQLAFEDVDPGRTTMPLIGHDAKAGATPKKHHRELRFDAEGDASSYEYGQVLDVSVFEDIKYVDIAGTGKGKGFQGGMKRHGFKGKEASHGVKRAHRRPGSLCGHGTNLGGGRIKKGKRMAGQTGDKRVTVRSLDVIAIDKERNLLMVKGPVPGANTGLLFIRESKRLNRRKTRLASA